ncbi:hypothetical protein PVAND_015128 [Polypedilum vanderplanki]|uniref:Uncharacterized protein n=1 Tax=Polypedilum vanderplanki TaxID=319348 RepID=A0A9J6BBQ4_POLVA|nr:hypothetical protein PVAND_015128 [Polypedilum vanderplanki]
MSQQRSKQTPFEKLTKDEQERILNSKVIIGKDLVKINEMDELEVCYDIDHFINSLTQQQIYDIQAGLILKFDPENLFESSGYSHYRSDDYDEDASESRPSSYANQQQISVRYYQEISSSPSGSSCHGTTSTYQPHHSSSNSLSAFELLTSIDQEKISNAEVQVPGYKVKLCDFIGTLDGTGYNDEDLYKLLSQEDIDKMLKGETIILYEDLKDSLDEFLRKSVDYNYEENGGDRII